MKVICSKYVTVSLLFQSKLTFYSKIFILKFSVSIGIILLLMASCAFSRILKRITLVAILYFRKVENLLFEWWIFCGLEMIRVIRAIMHCMVIHWMFGAFSTIFFQSEISCLRIDLFIIPVNGNSFTGNSFDLILWQNCQDTSLHIKYIITHLFHFSQVSKTLRKEC